MITEGSTLKEALEMVQDAMSGWLYVSKKFDDPIPPRFDPIVEERRRLAC